MKRIGLFGAAFAAIGATGAWAGNLETTLAPEPVVQAPVMAAPAPAGNDWTGFYAGAQVGYGDVSTNAAVSGDGALYGLHAGYNHDFGSVVAGGEVDYDWSDISLTGGAGDIDSVARAKVRLGYDAGRVLVYGTGGFAQAETSALGDDDGTFFGAGADYMISPSTVVGLEYLNHDFENFNGSGTDITVDTFRLKGSFRF